MNMFTKAVVLIFLIVRMVGLIALQTTSAFSAEIALIPTGTPVDLILVRGYIDEGDANRFKEIAIKAEVGAVLFDSPGGVLIEGLGIGELIQSHGFKTGVAPSAVCASACALAWLAGDPRYMDPSALIGFHAAYALQDGKAEESGVANALVGAYLTKLGLGYEAVIFATSAAPDGMNWLNSAQARAAGIDLILLSSDGSEIEVNSFEELKLPSGFRWIVMESSISASTLRTAALSDQIVKTRSGYFASVIGPYKTDVAMKLIESDPQVPSDAYLSSGNGFLFAVD